MTTVVEHTLRGRRLPLHQRSALHSLKTGKQARVNTASMWAMMPIFLVLDKSVTTSSLGFVAHKRAEALSVRLETSLGLDIYTKLVMLLKGICVRFFD